MDRIAWMGSRILDGLSYLPYFKGKGLLAIGIIRLCGPDHPVTMRLPKGGRMWVPNDNAGHALLPYLIGKYEHKTTRTFLLYLSQLKPGRCVIDIGANVGYYAIIAAHYLRQKGVGSVFAFEPNPIAFQYLQQNAKLNDLANLIALPQGVTDGDGRMTLYVNPEGITFSSLQPYLPHLTESYEVSIISLDNFMATHLGIHIGIMKIDIEGGELLALRGAVKLITRDWPVIMIIYEENELACEAFGYKRADLRGLLADMGYRLEVI